MRKVLSSLLVALLLPVVALGEDLSAASTDELVALRNAINQEIASRVDAEAAQTIAVDGVIFRLKLVEVGTAREGNPGLGIILLANNPTDASMTPLYDLGVTVTQGGKPLDTSWVNAEHFGSSSVSTSQSAVIAPGAVDMQIFLGFILDGEGSQVEITLSRKHTYVGEDPYCGTFSVDIADMLPAS
ncbi:MAG: hypothetical protein Q4B32_05515 [Clostridia bacterium]|nr:hypothetical protein [Clostridia bacterium]